MSTRYYIIWRKTEIGHCTLGHVDHWYFDASWFGNGRKKSIEFEELVTALVPWEIHENPAKGTRIILEPEYDRKIQLHAYVMGMEESMLMLSQVTEDKSINWLLRNVR
jgi:hypothetical protein